MGNERFSLKRKWELKFNLSDKEVKDLLLILQAFKEFSNRTSLGEKNASAAILADMLQQSVESAIQ